MLWCFSIVFASFAYCCIQLWSCYLWC